MHSTHRTLALVVVVAAGIAAACARAQEDADDEPATIESLAWLAGNWQRSDASGSFDERWMPPAGGTMAAVSRAVENGKTGLYELSVIEPTEAGLVLRIRHFGPGLTPWKSEAAGPGTWALASSGARTVVFEDPKNEFPRRIVYTRGEDESGKATLTARLDGGEDSPQAMEFRFESVD